jgi:hypothetical protein
LPGRKSKKVREPERDYSHRALLDKLGVKPGQRVAVLGVTDTEFLRDLTGRVPDFSKQVRGRTAEAYDVIFLAAESREDLQQVKSVARMLQKAASLWIVYPKGQSHIREADVFAAVKSAGLTDNKVARFSDTHTALRFVIPVARR